MLHVLYGIFAYISPKFMVNVGEYSIQWSMWVMVGDFRYPNGSFSHSTYGDRRLPLVKGITLARPSGPKHAGKSEALLVSP